MSRSLVAILILAGLNLTGLVQASPALAQGAKIAVVAPSEGPFALLGKQMLDGAMFQAQERGSEIVAINESCEPGDGPALAKTLVAAGVEAAIGFLCTESLEAVLPSLAEISVPALTLSVRSDILMEDALRKKWPFYRLVPSAQAEAARITDVILSRWKDQPLALIDDGTIHGRELVESVRSALADIGLTPVFNDTYRPAQEQQVALVRRLAKSGATHVFVGGDRTDTAIIARDAKSENINLTLMGGEALTAANQPVPLENGVLAVTLPDHDATSQANPVIDAMKTAGIVAEGYVLPAFAAVSLVEQAKDQAANDGTGLLEALAKGPYPTITGPVRFDQGHELSDNPYTLMEWRDGRFRPLATPGPSE